MMILQSSQARCTLMINKLCLKTPIVEDIIRDAPLQQERQLLTLIAQILHKLRLSLLVGIISKLIRNFIMIKLLVHLSVFAFFLLWDDKYCWFSYSGLRLDFYGQFKHKNSSIYDLFLIST